MKKKDFEFSQTLRLHGRLVSRVIEAFLASISENFSLMHQQIISKSGPSLKSQIYFWDWLPKTYKFTGSFELYGIQKIFLIFFVKIVRDNMNMKWTSVIKLTFFTKYVQMQSCFDPALAYLGIIYNACSCSILSAPTSTAHPTVATAAKFYTYFLRSWKWISFNFWCVCGAVGGVAVEHCSAIALAGCSYRRRRSQMHAQGVHVCRLSWRGENGRTILARYACVLRNTWTKFKNNFRVIFQLE